MPTLKNLTRNSFPDGLSPGRVLWAAEVVVVDEEGRTHGLRKPRGCLQTHAGAILEKKIQNYYFQSTREVFVKDRLNILIFLCL
jgi:hypothetical protein